MSAGRRASRVIGGGRLLHAIRLVAVLVAVTFGWRVSLAYLTPCLHDAPGEGATPQAKGDGCCPGADRAERATPSPSAAELPEGAVAELRAEHAGGDGEEGDCSCPIDCSPCCGDAVLHALTAVVPPPLGAVAVLAELPVPEPSTRHALADPTGILHVPRAA